MCTISYLDAEPAAALTWKALGALNLLFYIFLFLFDLYILTILHKKCMCTMVNFN